MTTIFARGGSQSNRTCNDDPLNRVQYWSMKLVITLKRVLRRSAASHPFFLSQVRVINTSFLPHESDCRQSVVLIDL